MWSRSQECMSQMVYIQAIPIPTTGHTLNPLEKLSNNPWLHRRIILEEPRTRKFQKRLEEQDPQEQRVSPV